MKKRLVSLLVLTIVLTLAAPIAMADHCKRCVNNECATAFTGGKANCAVINGVCTLSGTCSGPHPRIEEEPLAAEYFVASVERLDEARPASTETRVASLETKPSAKR